MINHGVIISQRDTDYVGGTIPYEERNSSGDWAPYLPLGEWQRNNFFDTFACVSFSALNSIEATLNWMLYTGKMDDKLIQRCIDMGWLHKK